MVAKQHNMSLSPLSANNITQFDPAFNEKQFWKSANILAIFT